MLESKIKELQNWNSENYNASTEENNEKYKELETIFLPIMTKMYQNTSTPQDESQNIIDDDDDFEPVIADVD